MNRRFRLATALAVLALAVPRAVHAQNDDGSNVDVAILDVLLERGLIDQQQYDELLAMARARASEHASDIDLIEGRLARLAAPDVQVDGGSPGKLEFKSPDGKWSLGLSGYIQARFTNRETQAPSGDGPNFSVPRARVIFAGNAGAENVKYKLEIDASTQSTQDTDLDATEPSEQKDARVKDAYVDYGVTESGSIRFGQYKFPFGREELISDSNGQLVEKSIASQAYSPKREPGISWQGKGPDGAFEYEFAAANGDGENEPNSADDITVPAGQTGDGLRYGARFVWYPLGEMKYDTPAFQTLDGGSRLALGVEYMINKDASFLNTVSAALPSGGTDADTLGFEAQWMTGPVSVLAEYYDRTTNPDGGPNNDDHGYTLQAGWFFAPKDWEVAARLSEVDQTDDSLLGAAAAKTKEKTIGINRYIDGQNGKWMLDYVMLDNETVPDQDEDQIRLQYQLKF